MSSKTVSVEVYPEINWTGGDQFDETTVSADVTIVRHLYGADADGNRGEWRTEIDEILFTSFYIDLHRRTNWIPVGEHSKPLRFIIENILTVDEMTILVELIEIAAWEAID